MPWNWFRKRASNPTARLELGERGEDAAVRFLRRNGYKILVRRFKSHAGEIDIIARQKDCLVFIEVKTRQTEQYGAPSEAVDKKKQRHMVRTAVDYLRLVDKTRLKFRFDIVEVLLREDAQKPDDIRIIQNAFDLTEPFIY